VSDAPAYDRLRASLAGRYRVERELGQGGMATVFLAEDLKHHRFVAIKVLNEDFAALLGARRFLQEIQTTAQLQHPHILQLHDSGEADGLLFYVMPFVEGESLRDRLSREGALPVAEAVRIAAEVADALDYAHRRGVVHRDIKPENILLQEGRVQVADFGIALSAGTGEGRLTGTGMAVGTPGYMSPEQALGERAIDARTDVYALGAVLYELLAGVPPFTGPTAQAIVAQVITERPLPPSRHRTGIPPRLDAVTLKALEKDPADRFAGAAELSAALQGAGEAVRVRASSAGRRTRSRWWWVALAGGVSVAAVMLTIRGRPERLPVADRHVPDTTAARLVQEADYWADKRTQEGCAESVPRYAHATVLDTAYAAAWAGYAHAQALCGLFSAGDPLDGFSSARADAAKALALDSGSARAWTVVGMARLFSDQDWLAARAAFGRAIALDSGQYEPWLYRTWTFEATNERDSALATIEHANRLAPTTVIVGARLSDVLESLGDTGRAREILDEVLRREPESPIAHQGLLMHALQEGACPAARAAAQWFRRRHLLGPSAGSHTYRVAASLEAQVWASCGNPAAARHFADSVRAVGRRGEYIDALSLALVDAALADTTAMFESLDLALAQHNWSLWMLGFTGAPIVGSFQRYRQLPHFQSLLRRLHES